ncbi:MAG: hypothetical protein KC443_09915 [Anaerolineales bacterium]|nr:hypothetical protein [Anaerolineales bacterium]
MYEFAPKYLLFKRYLYNIDSPISLSWENEVALEIIPIDAAQTQERSLEDLFLSIVTP